MLTLQLRHAGGYHATVPSQETTAKESVDYKKPEAVSVVILAKNEERAISGCLRSVQPLTADVHVIDSNSTDDTVRIARGLQAKVTSFDWNGKYPKKKEWALRNAPLENDWVLLLDADERITSALLDEIRYIVRDRDSCNAYDIPVRYHWRGHVLSHGQTVYKRSLLRKSACRFPVIADLAAPGITEVEGHYQPIVSGCLGRTTNELVHDDPDPLSDWFDRHNRYSDWEAYLRLHPDVRRTVRASRSRQGRILEALPMKPLVVFLYNYLVRQGWRDGMPGFEYAASLAFYQLQISMKVREGQSDLARLDAPGRPQAGT